MNDDFQLTPGGSIQPRTGGARPGAGRPKGRKNKLSDLNWKMALVEWPDIRAGLLKHAKRLNEPHHTPSRLEVECAKFVAERLWPEPRGAAVRVDISNMNQTAIMDAVASGDLTPADGAALIRAKGTVIDLTPAAAETDARAVLAERLARVIADRNRRAAAAEEPAPPDASVAPAPKETDAPPAADDPDAFLADLERQVDELERRLKA